MSKNEKKSPLEYSSRWLERNMRTGQFSRAVSIDPSNEVAREHFQYIQDRPHLKKAARANHKRAIAIATSHEFNGPNLFIDRYLRNFLKEYNGRVLKGEGSNLPLSFNVLNAFTEPDVQALILKLLPEKIYSVRLDAILDFITDPQTTVDFPSLCRELDELEIYEFNMIGGYADFQIPGHEKFVFCGVGFVRSHDELSIVGIFGRQNPEKQGEVMPLDKAGIFPGKERLFEGQGQIDFQDDDLFGDPKYQPVILLTRLSLSDNKIQVRYVLEEKKGAFVVSSDDPDIFAPVRAVKGKDVEEYIRNNIEGVQRHESLFSILALMPGFVTKLRSVEDDFVVERHPTKFKTEANSTAVRRLRAELPASETPNFVSVLTLIAAGNGGRYSTPPSGLKVETKGFWRRLPIGAVGADRHGRPVQGKTWVEETISWYEMLGFPQDQIGQAVTVDIADFEEGEGFLYVMRSAAHARHVYKIGFTTNFPDERASTLASETGQPDMFNVVQSWRVRKVRHIEKQVHARLDLFRVRAGREFFKLKYDKIRSAIEDVIKINDALIEADT